ncbi:MAG: hypothetical protein AMXMBFR23_11990 [Chloroflexota bacterium]
MEDLLDAASFSGLISRTFAVRVADASQGRLVVNGYPNGYPDLLVSGQYPMDKAQRADQGVEFKASRSESSWQAHGPREGWFVVTQFALDERPEVARLEREPTEIVAVFVARLTETDWSWQPAAPGRIRSGTASLKATGRARLRTGAVWVAPTYLERHKEITRKVALDAVRDAAKSRLRSLEFDVPATVAEIESFGLDPELVRDRVGKIARSLRKVGSPGALAPEQ